MNIALLEYFVTTTKTYVFLVKKDLKSPMVAEVDIGQDKIRSIYEKFSWNIARFNPSILKSVDWQRLLDKEFEEFYALGESLIACHMQELKKIDLLYIIPHKELHYFPFHAMKIQVDCRLCHVIERFQVVYLPAASILKHCQEVNPNRPVTKKVQKPLLLASWKNEDPKSFTDAACREVYYIANKLESEPFIGLDGSKSTFLSQAPEADLIHLACHGFFSESKDTMRTSGILLNNGVRFPENPSPDKMSTVSEHFISAFEILEIKLSCQLVTLSSCETGRSEHLSGDELIGLTRAFLYAQAPSLLMPLWHIQADSKAFFMKHFYDTWFANIDKGKSHAFQQATCRMLDHEDYCLLPHWGAYHLTGDWL